MIRKFLTAALLCAALPLSAAGSDDASFAEDPEVAQFIDAMREQHGFDAPTLRTLFEQTTPHPAVLRAIAPPSSPLQRSWQRYRSRFIEPRRIAGGVEFLAEHRASLARAESEFGVPAEIIVAIIGVETEYGRNTGAFSVFRALATLGFRYPPRAEFFRGELEQFLLLSRENGLDAGEALGSYAGAIGIPQFMPGSQRRFAVDFDNDGRIDLTSSVDDAIGSVASFLVKHGWRTGQPIVRPARLKNAPPEAWIAAGIKPSLAAADIGSAEQSTEEFPKDINAALIDLVTPGADTEYWWGFDNFYVITRYNRSSFYAMAVVQLAEAIAAARDGKPVKVAAECTGKRKASCRERKRRPKTGA